MSEELKKCAACRTEKPVKQMKVCMHSQMHYYVCDSKCMSDFYNPPKNPAAPSAQEYDTLKAERDQLKVELAALRATHPAPESVDGVEVVKVVGHLSHCADLYDPDAPPPPPQEPLMTVAQHNRIMAATVPAGSRVVPYGLLANFIEYSDVHQDGVREQWDFDKAALVALLEVKP